MYLGNKNYWDKKPEPENRGFIGNIAFIVTEFIKGFLDSVQIVVIFLALLAIVYLWVFSPHIVDGRSMFPTFHDKDFVLADKLISKQGEYKRGDVVIFKYDDTRDFIKRIIGLPGEKVTLKEGHIYINDVLLNEPYLDASVKSYPENNIMLPEAGSLKLQSDGYFVMGDNRTGSTDSRSFGEITPETHPIKGKVFVTLWPFSDFKIQENVKYNI